MSSPQRSRGHWPARLHGRLGGADRARRYRAGPVGLGLSGGLLAQASGHRIDVHHHVTPPVWLAELKKAKKDNPPLANWSVQRSLDDMDKAGIATSMTSPTTPQLGFLDKDTAAKVSRESNEWAKKMERDHKGRFGTFAMLPLPISMKP